MGIERDKNFDAFLGEYKDLPTQEKQNRIINELKELIGVAAHLCEGYKLEPKVYLSKEAHGAPDGDYKGDEFVESVYAYLQSYKELFGQFLEQYAADNYE